MSNDKSDADTSSPIGSKMRYNTKLLPSRCGNVGIIELNSLKSLNAIDLDMVRAMNDILSHWQKDPTLKLTLVTSVPCEHGQKNVFCAGGDVKSIYESVQKTNRDSLYKIGYGQPGHLSADFFREEYTLNYKIATQQHDTLPQVSIWDGIVMGGGVGISIHGKYRVATEHTLFSMPETAIGFFPDVGSTYWIPRLRKGGIGLYLALSGARLKANDLLYAGIATHFIPSSKLRDLKESLIESSVRETGEQDIAEKVLSSFHEEIPLDQSFLYQNRDAMDYFFANPNSMEEVIQSLNHHTSTFATNTLTTLRKMSPTSLKVTFEALKRCSALPDISSSLKVEYRLSQAFMRPGSDFYEGVRATLVDKDHRPHWKPPTLEKLTEEDIDAFFSQLGHHDLDVSSSNI